MAYLQPCRHGASACQPHATQPIRDAASAAADQWNRVAAGRQGRGDRLSARAADGCQRGDARRAVPRGKRVEMDVQRKFQQRVRPRYCRMWTCSFICNQNRLPLLPLMKHPAGSPVSLPCLTPWYRSPSLTSGVCHVWRRLAATPGSTDQVAAVVWYQVEGPAINVRPFVFWPKVRLLPAGLYRLPEVPADPHRRASAALLTAADSCCTFYENTVVCVLHAERRLAVWRLYGDWCHAWSMSRRLTASSNYG